MKKFIDWLELFSNSLNSFGQQAMGALPSILGALLILLIGWGIAKLVSMGLKKLLETIKFNKLAEKVNFTRFLEKGNVNLTASELVSKFVYWLLILFVVMTASDTLEWHIVSEKIAQLLGYLPKLFTAIVFFIIGMFIANFIRDFIKGATAGLGISAGSTISSVIYYFLAVVVSLTALSQAGFDTTILTSNLLVILGAIMATMAISYALASKDIMKNLLSSYFTKSHFKVGDKIEINGNAGTITDMSSINFTLDMGSKEVLFPINKLVSEEITRVK